MVRDKSILRQILISAPMSGAVVKTTRPPAYFPSTYAPIGTTVHAPADNTTEFTETQTSEIWKNGNEKSYSVVRPSPVYVIKCICVSFWFKKTARTTRR